MKKVILTLTIAAAFSFGVSSCCNGGSAEANDTTACCKVQTEAVEAGECTADSTKACCKAEGDTTKACCKGEGKACCKEKKGECPKEAEAAK